LFLTLLSLLLPVLAKRGVDALRMFL